MAEKKYSRQREAILNFLAKRKDHPTADVIYEEVRKEYPNISLGTVYRNLALFQKEKQILTLHTGDGKDHFDGNPQDHYHFFCEQCQRLLDLEIPYQKEIDTLAQGQFQGVLSGHSTCFHGLCPECAKECASKTDAS